MAPRGRTKKGQMRMDAALDAMMSYGFPEELIVTTVKELLDVYGMDGWPFIEEASYRVLLDSILEKVEKEAKEKGDSPPSGGRDGNNTKASCAGPSSEALVHTYSSEDALLQSNVNLDIASDTDNNKAPVTALRADGFECNTCPPEAEVEGNTWKDINLDQGSREQQMSNSNGNFHAVPKLGSSSHSVQHDICSPERVDALPRRSRRPFHGWISSDDEEELVELTPAPLHETLAKILYTTDVSKNRKRRWDVRPEDM
ncbi:hypothetical protein P3X46_025716 [Hevea brasiliensis]|uniref:WIYLD domain-containing protein n=1 Tax=Hevea brasiliensis TaxID=3981 RepID=A0ABQ9L898_HEVBR|nr:uncharacterized protein LOC110633282 isoform X1 [Hevea brasiliensis]KAJ9160303.1 hypothetical protein P3X46_025716 [Hevea brasiliensis]